MYLRNANPVELEIYDLVNSSKAIKKLFNGRHGILPSKDGVFRNRFISRVLVTRLHCPAGSWQSQVFELQEFPSEYLVVAAVDL